MKAYLKESARQTFCGDASAAGCVSEAVIKSSNELSQGFDIQGPALVGHNCDGKLFLLPPTDFYYVDDAPGIIKPASGLIKPQ